MSSELPRGLPVGDLDQRMEFFGLDGDAAAEAAAAQEHLLRQEQEEADFEALQIKFGFKDAVSF